MVKWQQKVGGIILEKKILGNRYRGRLKRRWIDDIERDLETLTVGAMVRFLYRIAIMKRAFLKEDAAQREIISKELIK